MIARLAVCVLACSFALSLSAQASPVLSTTGSLGPDQTITINLSGAAPSSFLLFGIGPRAGTSTVTAFGQNFVIGLTGPYLPLPGGVTDLSGAMSLSVPLGSAYPMVPAGVHIQCGVATIDPTAPPIGGFPIGLRFATTNVAYIPAL